MAPGRTRRSGHTRHAAGPDHEHDGRRRSLLRGAGLLAVAATTGCLGGLGNDGRRYAGHGRADLLLGVEAFPEGWEKRPDLNDSYDVFGDPDGDAFVGLDAAVLADAGAAEAAFEEATSGMADPKPYTLADEAFRAVVDGEYALAVFRHSNAVGQSFALRGSGRSVHPDRERSVHYAEAMFDHWQEL